MVKLRFFWYRGIEFHNYRWSMRGFYLEQNHVRHNYHYRTLIGRGGYTSTIAKKQRNRAWSSLWKQIWPWSRKINE